MLQLIYASAAMRPFQKSELERLLSHARIRNSSVGVTGMLLYHLGSFLQVLEGPEETVVRIFASIQRDPRHMNSKVLARKSIARGEFTEWAMGFENTSDGRVKMPGAVDYYRDLPKLTIGSTDARKYLRFFQEGLCRQIVR